MTLLATIAKPDYCVAISDLRVTYQSGNKFIPVDETFNKQINFNVSGFSGNITYTGVALWTHRGVTYKMFEVIASSLSKLAKLQMKLSMRDILWTITNDLIQVLNSPLTKNKFLELHVVGYEKEYAIPFLGCISNSKKVKPWSFNTENEYSFVNGNFNVFYKIIERPDFLVGGMTWAVQPNERETIQRIINSNAQPFDLINYCTLLIKKCSTRTTGIGLKSVSVLLPQSGVLDTNLYNKPNITQVHAYMPSIIFPNGTQWGPSELPVGLNFITKGHLRYDNIFFRSIVYETANRRLRRIIFKNEKGKRIPSLWEILGFALFGEYPEDAESLV